MSSTQPLKISIAMATYNGSEYLQEQLDSFLAQTRLPHELVITDDCSTDNTLEIIQAFAVTAPFEVRWHLNDKNFGYTGNFNQALLKTTGDLVFLSDQDDIWFPEKLERMERYALDHPNALVVMNDAALTDGELNDTGLTSQGQIYSAGMTESSFVMGCCVVVRRELLDVCLPIPMNFKGHDNWIVNMAEGVGRKLVVVDVLQCYRRHNQNESQFIGNLTSKVTRRTVFKRNLMNAIVGKNRNLIVFTEQTRLFMEGLYNASTRAPEPLSTEIKYFTVKHKKYFVSAEFRSMIREKPRFLRPIGILKLWINGGYAYFSGLKSALRDLIFR